MTKRIKHISELPTWFNLKKYEFTKTLNSLGWFKQLIPRALLFRKSEIPSNKIQPNHESTLNKLIILARNNPCLFIDDHTTFSLFTLIHCETSENCKNEKFLGIYPNRSKKASTNPMQDLYQIDYNFSDEFLIENFKKCLAIARKKYKSTYRTPYRTSDFQHWAKLGVLPYLDLLTWSLEENKHITHRVLANALYPYGDKGEETIRKTTTPLVEEIVSQNSMIQLHAQARTTIVERNLR